MKRNPIITVGWLHDEQPGHAIVGTVLSASARYWKSKRVRIEHTEHADDAGWVGAVVTVKTHRLIQLIEEPENQR